MEGNAQHLPPGDPQLINNIVNHLKSQGIFDEFRRDLLADADTKPSYQNLRQRVEGYASKFLAQQTWQPDLNKNQLRDTLRRQINESGMLASGVDHVLEQLIGPKIVHVFLPKVETLVKEYLGLIKPPPPASIFDNTEAITKNLPAETVQQKRDETEAVQNKTNVVSIEISTSKSSNITSLNVEVKKEKDEAIDSLLVTESGAEQSDSSMLDYSGSMGRTPPPPGVSEDELSSYYYFKDDIRTKEKSEICSLETEKTPYVSDSKDLIMKDKLESEITNMPENMKTDSDEKQPECTKVLPVDRERKSEKPKVLPLHEKSKPLDRERSRSADSSKSKHSENKVSKVESKPRFSENSSHKGQEKSKKQDGSSFSKSKHSLSSDLKKPEIVKQTETKFNRSLSESPAKPEKPKSDSHSSKSSSGSSLTKSSKLKQRSSSKSGKTEVDSKHTSSSKSISSKVSKYSSSENKCKHSEKHSHKSKHSGDSPGNSSKEDKPKIARSESVEEKISKQHGAKSQGSSRDFSSQKSKDEKKKTPKDGKNLKSTEMTPEGKSCKDGHGCSGKILSTRKIDLPDGKQTLGPQISSVEECYSSVRNKSETGDEMHVSEVSCSSVKNQIVDDKQSTSSSQECHNSNSSGVSEDTCSQVKDLSSSDESYNLEKKSKVPEAFNAEESLGSQTTSSNRDCYPHSVDCTVTRDLCKLVNCNTEPKEDAVNRPLEVVSEANATNSEDRGDILREILMDKKTKGGLDETKSDITVSSVHTSDLSSFDDGISLSSVDEIEIPEVDQKKKKVPLKEVKEIAAVILKEKSISSGRSTPLMSSVDLENNKDTPLEAEEQANDPQSDEEQERSKMWLRRERRVNPKYASEEYSSIFNEGTSASFESDDNEGEIPSRMTKRGSQETHTPQEKMKRRHSKDREPETKPKVAKISRRSQQASETAAEANDNMQQRRKTRSNSENQDASEIQALSETSKKKQRSYSSSLTLPDTTKQEHHRASTSSQRYDSSDLYKPRPIISSRRSRNSQEMQNTQVSSGTGRTTRRR